MPTLTAAQFCYAVSAAQAKNYHNPYPLTNCIGLHPPLRLYKSLLPCWQPRYELVKSLKAHHGQPQTHNE